ncbi:MAG: zinc-binding alcohol dehydrogenase [Clostridia bacterium]|nr:zinc-binding alcohol dehydrogenase [Clostridia bacterium]
MDNKQIVFTKINTAEFLDSEKKEPGENEVCVKTEFSTISPGTEKANITGDPNVSAGGPSAVVFPRCLGYSSSGTVVSKGKNVSGVDIGDRVVVFWGTHSKYNTVSHDNVVKISDEVSFEEAAMSFITTFPMAAIRKTRLEIGESAIVMGLGLLGQLAIRLLRTAGAAPIIAVDPVESRREEAKKSGADFVFSPFEENFSEKVKSVTDGGANVAIEVTGVGAGLDGVLDCMAKFGRVALLGCTRDKNFTIDYYNKVHSPGINLIGAHTMARPNVESSPGYFTHQDDIRAILKLCKGSRIDLKSMIKETHSPRDCVEIYDRLINDRDFPILVQFDWRNV